MRRALSLILASALVSACSSTGGAAGDQPVSESAEIMAAALTQLVTVDHTFGDAPPPFTVFLIQSKTDFFAGTGTPSSGDRRDLTTDERDAIDEAISEYGPVAWINNATAWRTDELMPVVEGSVILGVGEPVVEEDTALVPISLWCGGLCGTWFSYRVDLVDGSWVVTDIEGPVAIS